MHLQLKTVAEAESIVHQVAISLYIAEKELHFEHRDLHIGNILIKETASRHIGGRERKKREVNLCFTTIFFQNIYLMIDC